MEKIWFISIDDTVFGPLTTEDAESKLQAANPQAGCLVWWKGQSQWIAHTEWRRNRDEILRARNEAQGDDQRYFLDFGKDAEGPYRFTEVIQHLKSAPSLEHARIWSSTQKRWQSVYEMAQVCESLNITRRAQPRVPLKGTATLQKDQLTLLAPITTVSLGGFGMKLEEPTQLSGVFSVSLRCPSLFNVIKTRAEVAYCKPDGTIGFKFLSLNSESQSVIIQYVRSFEEGAVAA